MQACHCGAKETFENCCGAFLAEGATQWPQTPEALMRARYSAHVLVNVDFLKSSYHPEGRDQVDWSQTEQWAASVQWLGLELRNPQQEGDQAAIELLAHYREPRGARKTHHELSLFRRDDEGRWCFYDAKLPNLGTQRRQSAKIGRNAPCPCGSGKKYKQCCAAA